jgi:hypothetical protein
VVSRWARMRRRTRTGGRCTTAGSSATARSRRVRTLATARARAPPGGGHTPAAAAWPSTGAAAKASYLCVRTAQSKYSLLSLEAACVQFLFMVVY